MFKNFPGMLVLSILLLFACLFPFSDSRASGLIEKNVLIVLPFTQDYLAHMVLTKGIKDSFARQNQYAVRFSYEYLDLARFAHEADYLSDVAWFFQEKYSRLKPDVVVTGATLSEFMLSYGKHMFPGVPIVFAWSENITPLQAMPEGHYIVSGAVDYEANFRLILQTRPSTKQIHIVVGDSVEERRLVKLISRAAEPFSGRVAFDFLNTLPYAQMMERIRNLDEDSAVLFVRWIKDSEGEAFIPLQVVWEICRESKAPVFSVTSHILGTGVVGGYFYSLELLGEYIVAQAMNLFDGKAPPLPVSKYPVNEYGFDWRELKRWEIADNLLPPGSKIEYRENNAWDLYKEYILGGIALVLLEAILVFYLVVNRVKRIKVEGQLIQLNTSLEKIVYARTEELHEKNAALKSATQQLEKINKILELHSITDSLTGLYNRRYVEERIQDEFSRFLRSGTQFAVGFVDIDYFKTVNDVHGHAAGDRLLQLLSQDLREVVRTYDTVARWGGEEFLILFPTVNAEEARGIAERLREVIASRCYVFGDESLKVTLTIGISSVLSGDTVADVIRRADDALYEGKRSGRDRVVAA